MKKVRLALLHILIACVPGVAFALPVDCNISFNGSNAIQVAWNTVPDGIYRLESSTNIAGPWQDALPAPGIVPATNDPMIETILIGSASQFYRVVWLDLALIPAGSFTMGNSFTAGEGDSDELPLHSVYVSAFYMDKYEVTKALWDDVYNWAITHGYSFEYGAHWKAANHPAQTMTWYDAVKWCNARSEKEGRVPAYYTDAGLSVRYRTGQVAPYVNWSSGYRLPTEAEWEKAARGGLSGHRFPWADADTINQSRANYYSFWSVGMPYYPYDVNSISGYHPTFNDGISPYTSPVGYFAANGYGLYDMAGNVWEWCWDWYGAYSSGSQTDPRGSSSGSYRVYRGSSWYNGAFGCRAADPNGGTPDGGSYLIGFRSVLPQGQ